MKKRMLIAFALIAIMATSAFAADFGWGGAFRSAWAIDMGTDALFSGLQFGVLSTNAKLDDNNTVTVVLEYADNGKILGTSTTAKQNWNYADIKVETANLKTDILGALGADAPVTLVMNNGFGRLNIHDRFNGVGTGWDPEVVKSIGALDGSWARYAYTGFDIGIMDMVNVRLYSMPASWNSDGANILIEAWAPIAIADIMTLDVGAFMIMKNGFTPAHVPFSGDATDKMANAGKMIIGLRVKGDMSFGIVGLGFWVGGTATTENKLSDDMDKYEAAELTALNLVQAVNATFAFNDSMNLKIGVWAKEVLNLRSGDELKAFNDKDDKVKAADPELQIAFDGSFNFNAFTVYGGVITTDLIVNADDDKQTMNGRWDMGVGYNFGATSMRLGITGALVGKDIGTKTANLPENDGLAITGALINGGADTALRPNSDGTTLAALYFMAGVWF